MRNPFNKQNNRGVCGFDEGGARDGGSLFLLVVAHCLRKSDSVSARNKNNNNNITT